MWIAIVFLGFAAALTAGLLLRKQFRRFGNLILILSVIGVLIVGTATGICWTKPYEEKSYDYAILLGALLEEGKPTPELERRMELALDWMKTDADTILFVSGGEPKDQGITEAQVMYDWLVERGANGNRIVMEEKAADTLQNLRFSRSMADEMGLKTDTVLLLSSEYHQTRAGFLAAQLGQDAAHLSCRTPFLKHLNASFREVFAFIKAFAETL